MSKKTSDQWRYLEGDDANCISAGGWLASEIASRLGWGECRAYQFGMEEICWGAVDLYFTFPEDRLWVTLFKRRLLTTAGVSGPLTLQVIAIRVGRPRGSDSSPILLPGTDLIAGGATGLAVPPEPLLPLIELSAKFGLVWSGKITGVVTLSDHGKTGQDAGERLGLGCYAADDVASEVLKDDDILHRIPFTDFSSFVAAQERGASLLKLEKAKRANLALEQELNSPQ